MTALNAFSFNPLESLDDLKSSGVGEKQARAFIKLVQQSASASFEHLATKEDLVFSENRLENKISEVKIELKQDIAELRGELKQDITKLKGELKRDIAELRGELKQDITELKGEFRQELAENKGELKQDIAAVKQGLAETKGELKQDIAELKTNVTLMTKLFFGSTLLIMINIAITLLHHA